MNTAALRQLIQRAHQHEATTGQLARQLDTQLERLHPSIRLPVEDAQGVLARFVAAALGPSSLFGEATSACDGSGGAPSGQTALAPGRPAPAPACSSSSSRPTRSTP